MQSEHKKKKPAYWLLELNINCCGIMASLRSELYMRQQMNHLFLKSGWKMKRKDASRWLEPRRAGYELGQGKIEKKKWRMKAGFCSQSPKELISDNLDVCFERKVSELADYCIFLSKCQRASLRCQESARRPSLTWMERSPHRRWVHEEVASLHFFGLEPREPTFYHEALTRELLPPGLAPGGCSKAP